MGTLQVHLEGHSPCVLACAGNFEFSGGRLDVDGASIFDCDLPGLLEYLEAVVAEAGPLVDFVVDHSADAADGAFLLFGFLVSFSRLRTDFIGFFSGKNLFGLIVELLSFADCWFLFVSGDISAVLFVHHDWGLHETNQKGLGVIDYSLTLKRGVKVWSKMQVVSILCRVLVEII